MEQFVRANLLLDFYGQLLTERQLNACRLYYEENFSLGEIALELGISRQAVHDSIRRATSGLEGYEQKLGLVGRFSEQQQELRRLKELLQQGKTAEVLPLLERLIL
ncbi:MAG: YlxM family DNA-binding protein [Bacillota bacterium]|nr:YlxM family DNA-binding protein [Bacillota bacterium]